MNRIAAGASTVLACLVGLALAARGEDNIWQTDFPAAQAKAKGTGAQLLNAIIQQAERQLAKEKKGEKPAAAGTPAASEPGAEKSAPRNPIAVPVGAAKQGAPPAGLPPGAKRSGVPKLADLPKRELDVCAELGITPEKLQRWLQAELESGSPVAPLVMFLRTRDDKCLTDCPVTISWDGGTETVNVDWTGQIVVGLNRQRVKALKLTVPEPFTRLTQTTFPEGKGYRGPADFGYFNVEVVDESPRIRREIQSQLLAIRQRGEQTPASTLRQQLGRTRCTVNLLPPSGKPMTPADIYRERKASVVIMARLHKAGYPGFAAGAVIAPDGIVVTNYHVMCDETGDTEVFAARLADGRMFPVREVLAADRATDVAIVRIAADHLAAAPLSRGEPVGAPVTIIAHPDGRAYFLTTGSICRYARALYAGDERVYLEVSAEFMPGSSGGPAFSADGSVAGIVSTIVQNNRGMTFRQCIPVQSIRRLIDPSP